MTKASDNLFPKLIIQEAADDGSDFSNPSADYRVLFVGEDGDIHLKSSSGTVTDFPAGGGGGGDFDGFPAIVAPVGIALTSGNFGWGADLAECWPIVVAGPMKLQSLVADMASAASGTYEWGLFDCSANPASCTKIAGGSGSLNGTGWQAIAATGAPVDVPAGGYFLILKAPAANTGSMNYGSQNTIPGGMKANDSYVWDDTPDITSGWTSEAAIYRVLLKGRIDASTQW